MPDKKRVTTSPLTQDEIAEALAEIPEEEFLTRFDDIFVGELDLPGKLEGLITLDDYMENELREMFQSIIAQYIHPIERVVERVLGGDTARRTAQEGLDALAPILSASESLSYGDISDDLKRIEAPLVGLASGAKRRLAKRELAELTTAWERLRGRLRPDGQREQSPATPLSLNGLTRLDGVTSTHVRSLRGAGLQTLGDLASAPLDDLVAVSGLPELVAERVRAFAVGASVVAGAPPRRSTQAAVPAGWVRVRVDSEAFKGTFTFEAERFGSVFEPVLERLAAVSATPTPVREPAAARPKRPKAVGKKRVK